MWPSRVLWAVQAQASRLAIHPAGCPDARETIGSSDPDLGVPSIPMRGSRIGTDSRRRPDRLLTGTPPPLSSRKGEPDSNVPRTDSQPRVVSALASKFASKLASNVEVTTALGCVICHSVELFARRVAQFIPGRSAAGVQDPPAWASRCHRGTEWMHVHRQMTCVYRRVQACAGLCREASRHRGKERASVEGRPGPSDWLRQHAVTIRDRVPRDAFGSEHPALIRRYRP